VVAPVQDAPPAPSWWSRWSRWCATQSERSSQSPRVLPTWLVRGPTSARRCIRQPPAPAPSRW